MKHSTIVNIFTSSRGQCSRRFLPVLYSSLILPQIFTLQLANTGSRQQLGKRYFHSSRNHFVGFASADNSYQDGTYHSSSSSNQLMQSEISYVNADLAKLIDDRLMSSPGYTLDQLMELAGYSVACAAYDILHSEDYQIKRKPIYIFCGPGNNGGDGLVAARHLKHFGYSPSIIYPKQSKGEIFSNLIHQLHGLEIPILTESPDTTTLAESALLIDGMFGFSFKGPSREPYSSIINQFRELQSVRPILSIDIPSGWDVNEGDIYSSGFLPSSTISLSTPKLCMRMYPGDHYVGGRFIPPSLAQELKLILPDYGDNVSQIVKLPKNSVGKASAAVCNAEISKVDKVVAMYSTASSSEEAKRIAHHLISQKLAACVNIIPQIQSVYEWEGKVEDSTEYLLMIKTRKSLADQVSAAIKSVHSYDLPESIVVDISDDGSSRGYLDWVRTSTTAPDTTR